MLGILPFALLLELFTRACASPVVDAMHPMITQRAELFGRDVAPGFIGYFQTTDESGSQIITSAELTSSVATFRGSTLIDFCPDDEEYLSSTCSDAYWTSCSGTMLYSAGGSSPCSTTCDYDIIYTGSTSDSNSLRWYHCMSEPWRVYYREEPEITSGSDTSSQDSSASETSSEASSTDPSTGSASPSSSRPSSSSTGTIASETSSSTHSATSTAEPEKEKAGGNKVWIAGVVVGTVGLLAVAGMGFFLWRQRQKKHAYDPAPQGPSQALQAPPEYTAQQAAYYNPQQVPYGNALEYYGHPHKPVEMYAGYGEGSPPGVGVVELPAGTAGATKAQPHMAAEVHELPELAPPSTR